MSERNYYTTDPEPRPDLLEPRNDEHVWIAAAVFRLSPETLRAADGIPNLDRENLATIQLGCFVCEQPYSERLSYRKCPGEPRE